MAQPKLRLKGFEGEWTECSFGKIGKTYSGLSGKNKEDFGSGNARYITFLNVLINAQINPSLLEHVNVQKSERQNEVKKGDMFFNTSSETPEEVGMCSVMNENLSNVYLNSFCFGFRLVDDNINPLYIAYLMRSPIGRKIMMILAQGATRYNLSKRGLSKASIHIPETKKEQEELANYFNSLDSLIQTATKKIASLKQLKSASLVSMFPQGDEEVPRVRFKGFEGEWKYYSFGKLYRHNVIKNDLTFGTDKVISVANMHYTSNTNISDENYLRTYNIFRIGDIAFEGNKSKDFAHGRFVENTIGDGIVSHVFEVFTPISDEYDLNYWKYAINNERIMGKILLRCTKASTMMTNLTANEFLRENILVPSYEEQKEIGQFFASLDSQISIQEQRLEKLKQIKASCLEKMFV